MSKLNIGAGSDIRADFINHDIAQLEGIDVVHDLNIFPWPWQNESVEEIVMNDVVEHLIEFTKTMEELHRILTPGGVARIRVPHMGSWSFYADPTHKRAFVEATFLFFDPRSEFCKERFYYSDARFHVENVSFVCAPFIPFFTIPGIGAFRVKAKLLRNIIGLIDHYFFRNLIQDIELDLIKV